MGYAIYQVAKWREPAMAKPQIAGVPVLLPAAVGLSLLPDIDMIPSLIFGDIGQFHNNISHSLLTGLLVGLVAFFVLRAFLKHAEDALHWAGLLLAAYEIHIVMDFFTQGRGVKVLWPLIPDRLDPGFALFYGLHWSEPITALNYHLVTLVTELAFAGVLLWLVQAFIKSRADVGIIRH